MTRSQTFLNDLFAGLTTSFAAIALGAAFGIQAFGSTSPRGAFAGMVGAALIPIITSIFGGTRLQASGPTAPMTTISTAVIALAYSKFGSNPEISDQFIAMVFMLNAILLILSGLFRLGRFISLVPQVVVLGFMNGIALLIWRDQIKKIFGLGGTLALAGDVLQNALLAFVTFVAILSFPFLTKKLRIPDKIRPFLPGTLVVIIAMTYFFVFSGLNLETVKLGGSISPLEFLQLPATYFPKPEILTVSNLQLALPLALQLTLLGYLDSLLTSLVIDKMTKEETKKEKELVAQGLANGVSALFGGIPGAQATIRSIILLKEGAKTRLAGVLIGIFSLIGIFLFQNLLSLVASAIFAGVLLKAGLDVFDKDYFSHYFSKKWYQKMVYNWQMILIVYTTLITVFFDLNIAVVSGTILFYLGKKYLSFKDVDSEEMTNVSTEV
jgi:SulP family sulfate permease